MNIIIVGNGKVGYTLATHLSKENNDVVIIDTNPSVLKKAEDVLDVMCIVGNGLSVSSLLEARVKTADLIIAATSRDEINMLCCLTAKKLGVKHAIARIRDPEYAYELSVLKKELELDMIINPEQEAAGEIVRLLRFPTANNIETFVNGKVELISFRIQEKDVLVGQSLAEVTSKYNLPILFATFVRQNEIIIPDGSYKIQTGDVAYIIGQPSVISNFFKKIGKYPSKIKNVMVIGGGRIAFYLCAALHLMGIHSTVIENDEARCIHLSELLPHSLIINADGTDPDVLASENMAQMGAVIALTGRDEENLFAALYATHVGVKKVVAKINRINYGNIIDNLGIESIVSPKNITAYQIIRYVRALKNSRGSNIETLYKIVDGEAEALEFTANQSTANLRKPFKNVDFKEGFLVAAIVRHGKIIIPSGNDYIEDRDNVIIITKNSNVSDLNDVFENGGK